VREAKLLITSELAAPASEVWSHVASLEGVNHELGPLLHMTAPAGTVLTPESVPLGRRWFRSWVLLFGVLPVDYDALCIERIDPERGFLERSSMLSARVWEHERTLEPLSADTTRVSDRVQFEPRLRLTARLHLIVIRALFAHRHRRLRARFGSAAGPDHRQAGEAH
jgi:ligand-binding SRPBCC domain-containing protein